MTRLRGQTARVRALPARRPVALRDALFDLCEEAGRVGAGCAATRGTEGACLFLLQRLHERDALKDEILEGRRALARLPAARRGDEYPYLVGGYEHELEQLDVELSRLAEELRDRASGFSDGCAPAAAEAFDVAAQRLGGLVGTEG